MAIKAAFLIASMWTLGILAQDDLDGDSVVLNKNNSNFLFADFTSIVVVGGFGRATVERFDLDGLQKDCIALPEYPFFGLGHSAVYYKGDFLVCGGVDGNSRVKGECYSLDVKGQEWVESFPLPDGPRYHMSSSLIDGKWFLSGGMDETEETMATTFLFEDGIFTPGPDMPAAKYGHCQATLNDTHLFFTDFFDDTFVLDLTTMEYTILDSMPQYFGFAACGVLNHPERGQEVLLSKGSGGYLFNLNTLEWHEGPSLPLYVIELTGVQLSDGILAVAGDGKYGDATTVFRIKDNNYEWKLEGRLQAPRDLPTAAAIPDKLLSCIPIEK